MQLAKCSLKSASPYSQSRFYQTEKLSKESASDYETRTWKDRGHYDSKGVMFIPPMQFANSLKQAARYLGMKIPGKKNATYTKHFESGVMVKDPMYLTVTKDNVEGEWVHVPSDGKRGGSSRVSKCFPVVKEWEGVVDFYILDDTITLPVFESVLKATGQFIGVGRFRPSNLGYYGRFTVEGIKWQDLR